MKLWDKISSLIADEKVARDESKQHAAPQPEEDRTGDSAGADSAQAPLSPTAANAVLSMLPKGQGLDQFSAGQIQLLNIESVREELGDRWTKFEHQVHLLVEATLRRMLSESDIFTQISDYEYLVIFPNLSEQKASALMYVAAAQIRQKLFGHDPAFAAIRLNATVTRVGRDVMDRPPDAVTAIHEATLLGEPAQPGSGKPEEQPLISPIRPWTDKYKIVPIEGGHMSQARLVPDSLPAPGAELDLSGLGNRSAAATDAAAQAGHAAGPDQHPPAPVAGYPVVPIAGAGTSDPRVMQEPARPQRRLPDFSGVKETFLHHPSTELRHWPAGAATQHIEDGAAPQGYPVAPVKASRRRESYLVQGAPRAHARLPDFSSAHMAESVAASPAGSVPGGGVVVPTVTARLDSLTMKPAAFKAVPIGRPSDADEGGRGGDSTVAVSGAAHAQAVPLEIEKVQLLYKPIWDVRRQAVTAYRMKITLTVEGTSLGLSEFCATYDDGKLQHTLNSLILRKLVRQIQLMRGEKNKAIIVAPISRRFIDAESGLRLVLDQLSVLSEPERQLVVLEIGDAYLGSWPALTPRIALIHRMCRNVGIRLSLDHADFQPVGATGANTAAADLSDHEWPESQILRALNSFAAGSAKAALRSSVAGLSTSSMVIAAVCAGLGHLSGSAIGDGTPAPLGVYPLSTEGFYLQRQSQRLQQRQEQEKVKEK